MKKELISSDQPLTITVDPDTSKKRIDHYLHEQFPIYTRSFFQRAIRQGIVTVNDKKIHKSGHIVAGGDTITVIFPPERSITNQMIKEKIPDIPIIAQHEHFIIIDKPAGLLVHPTHTTNQEVTLMDWLVQNLQGITNVGYVDRPGIIHRLDRLTSGLMVIPLTNYAYAQFGTMFRDRTIKKIYYAIVTGHPPQEGTIDFAIGRHPTIRNRMMTFKAGQEHPKGSTLRHAVTHFQTEGYYEGAALVHVRLETGRTHQIRAHMAAIGHPIIGDIVYGKPSTYIDRQALHAHELNFTFDNKNYTFQSPLPEDMTHLLKKLTPIEQSTDD